MFPHRASAYLAIALAFFLFGLALIMQPTAHAQDQPEALGSLSGVVHNKQGDPLPNITVWLEIYTNTSDRRSVTTNAQGEYHFASVRPAGYKVRFEDTTGVYAQLYYEDALFADDAETVVVNGNNISNINVELEIGGSIFVTIQASTPLTTTSVNALLYRQNKSERWALYRSKQGPLGQVNTHLIGLPPGTYRLCAAIQSYLDSSQGYKCYDNVVPEAEAQVAENATNIVVEAGNETNITITFGDIIQMQGFVRTPNGDPLAGVSVTARDSEEIPYHYPSVYYYAITDENGYFRFVYMRSASYKLLFNQQSYYTSDYLPSFYLDSFDWNDATLLKVTPDSRHNLEMVLTPEARISGKVTLPENVPVENFVISLYEQGADGTWQPSYNCLDPHYCYPYTRVETGLTTGAYTATQIVPGSYRIQASEVGYFGNFLHGFFGGDTLEEADTIVIEAGQTISNINIVLGENGFDSRLTGTVVVDGKPQPNVEVGLFNQHSQFSNPEPVMPMLFTSTDAQGHYLFDGLPGGIYRIAARDPAGIYATTFYTNSSPDSYSNQWVNVPFTGTTISNLNIPLTLGGSISGRVHVAEGSSPADYEIVLLDLNGFYTQAYIDVHTDKDGLYKVTGVPSGRYVVSARPPDVGSVRYHPAAKDPYSASAVEVEAGKERTGIHISFSQRPTFLPRVGLNIAAD
jgi:protocatechuate 3,4-dioxygenase beta subunit